MIKVCCKVIIEKEGLLCVLRRGWGMRGCLLFGFVFLEVWGFLLCFKGKSFVKVMFELEVVFIICFFRVIYIIIVYRIWKFGIF